MAHINKKRFRPENATFRNSSKINPKLLADVVDCYQRGQRICKFCYYRKQHVNQIPTSSSPAYCTKCRQNCETVWLMPASNMCDNFGNLREVPIPPAPRWFFKHPNKPFGICQSANHSECFKLAANNDIWYAHTIEELVIWTIEREYGCTFRQYCKQYHYKSRPVGYLHSQRPSSRTGSHLNLDLDDFDEFPSPSKGKQANTLSGNLYNPQKRTYKFKRVEDIPQDLLEDVMNLYMQKKSCCKRCYYHHNKESSMVLDSYNHHICKSCHHFWDPVTVIPASKLCQNFGKFTTLPVARPPSRRPYPNLPHEYCGKEDHHRCFQIYPTSGFWYAHSVEELVIWTVEKDYGSFDDYLDFCGTKFEPEKPMVASASANKTTQENGFVEVAAEEEEEEEEERKEAEEEDAIHTARLYEPSSEIFASVSDIPKDLLGAVAKCYDSRLNTCRECFYGSLNSKKYNGHPTLSSKQENSSTCERGHYWRPVRVIPSCNMCVSYGSYVAIPSIPSHMCHLKSPFKVCNNGEHDYCFDRSRTVNPWFPHTIEEMVIWTVERDTEKDFSAVYRQFIPLNKKVNLATKKVPNPRPPSPSSSSQGGSGPSLFQSDSSSSFGEGEKRRNQFQEKAAAETLSEDFELKVAVASQELASESDQVTKEAWEMTLAERPREKKPTAENQTSGTNNLQYMTTKSSTVAVSSEHRPLLAANFSMSSVAPLVSTSSQYPSATSVYSAASVPPVTSTPYQAADQPFVHQSHAYYSHAQPQVFSSPAQVPQQNVPKQSRAGATMQTTTSYAQGLQFDDRDEDLTAEQTVQNDPSYSNQDMTLPLGGEALTLQEASTYFPALLGSAAPASTSISFYTQQPATSEYYGPKLDVFNLSSMPGASAMPANQYSVSKPMVATPVQPQAVPSTLPHTQEANDDGSDSEEADEVYECFLCYREFDSAQEIAKHCSKEQHISMLEKDIGALQIWRHFPPPPDKTPSEFSICKRKSRCPSRLKCCKAHSQDELQEWTTRYQHRAQGTDLATRQNLMASVPQALTQLSTDQFSSKYPAVKIVTSSQLSSTITEVGKPIFWSVTLKGQGWQTLNSVECHYSGPSSSDNVFKISSIEGDTFFTIQPKSSCWNTHSVDEGILLGRATILVKAVPVASRDYTCQLRFGIGFHELLYVNLELMLRSPQED